MLRKLIYVCLGVLALAAAASAGYCTEGPAFRNKPQSGYVTEESTVIFLQLEGLEWTEEILYYVSWYCPRDTKREEWPIPPTLIDGNGNATSYIMSQFDPCGREDILILFTETAGQLDTDLGEWCPPTGLGSMNAGCCRPCGGPSAAETTQWGVIKMLYR